MGYKKGYVIGTNDGLQFGNYQIGRYHNNNNFSPLFDKGCVVLIDKRIGKYMGATKKNILRNISFDLETNTIIFDSKKDTENDFKELHMRNITNKEFFNYVRNHMEKLFGELYDVTPNDDRTSFELLKK